MSRSRLYLVERDTCSPASSMVKAALLSLCRSVRPGLRLEQQVAGDEEDVGAGEAVGHPAQRVGHPEFLLARDPGHRHPDGEAVPLGDPGEGS